MVSLGQTHAVPRRLGGCDAGRRAAGGGRGAPPQSRSAPPPCAPVREAARPREDARHGVGAGGVALLVLPPVARDRACGVCGGRGWGGQTTGAGDRRACARARQRRVRERAKRAVHGGCAGGARAALLIALVRIARRAGSTRGLRKHHAHKRHTPQAPPAQAPTRTRSPPARTVRRLGLDRLAVGRDEHAGHQPQRPVALVIG